MQNYLENVTVEQRQEWLAKAHEARKVKKQAGAHLIQDHGDDETVWRSLASSVGFRMPALHIPASELKYVRKLLKKIDRDMDWCKTVFGYSNMARFYKDNPAWSIVALCGLILEDWNEEIENGVGEYID